ncbi:MAG: tyrosine phosphatase family protein [Pseudomonadota bacterium]
MPEIHVCPLSKLTETIERSSARHVITLINRGTEVPYPLSIPVEQRLFLGFNDIVTPAPGLIPPEEVHAREVIDYVQSWDQKDAMVIHCWMGISRSTAGAFIALCALNPDHEEDVIAKRLRAASPVATPNIRLVQFADRLLEREGRMVRAIEDIGRGAETFEGIPFNLPAVL